MDSINILPQTERSGWLVGIEIDSSVKLIDRYTPAALPAPQCRSSQQETCVSLRWTTALPGSPGNPPPGWSGVTASCTSRPTGCRPQRWVSTTYQTIPAAQTEQKIRKFHKFMVSAGGCWQSDDLFAEEPDLPDGIHCRCVCHLWWRRSWSCDRELHNKYNRFYSFSKVSSLSDKFLVTAVVHV